MSTYDLNLSLSLVLQLLNRDNSTPTPEKVAEKADSLIALKQALSAEVMSTTKSL